MRRTQQTIERSKSVFHFPPNKSIDLRRRFLATCANDFNFVIAQYKFQFLFISRRHLIRYVFDDHYDYYGK